MSKLIITIGIFVLCQSLHAQRPDTIKDLPAEQVEVIKQFEAYLEDARKVNVIPEPPAQRVLEQFQYDVSIRPIMLDYPDPSIKPVAVSPEPKTQTYNGFLRAAAGNLNTLDAAAGYNFLTRRETDVTIAADYLTMNNKNERFQQIQRINAGLQVQHTFTELATLSGGVKFKQEDVGFFGSPIDTSVIDTSIYMRRFRNYGANISLFNGEQNEYNVDYSVGFTFDNFALEDEELAENNFLIDGAVRKQIGERFGIFLEGLADISSITDTTTIAYNNYFVKPGVTYVSDQFSLDAAVNFAFATDQVYYLPDVEISFSPLDYGFIPYVFYRGELQKNNVQTIFTYNPFLSTGIVPTLDNSIVTRYGIGAKGNFKNFTYDASVGYGKTENLMLFRNRIGNAGLRQFDIETDTSNILDIQLGANYVVSDKFEANVVFTYTDYDITAWHLPSYTVDVGVSYYLLDRKLKISPSLFIRDGVTVLNDEREVEELPYLVDLNLHVDYKIHNQFAVFAQANNILSSEYQQWFDYSNFGINAKVGLKIKF